MAKQDLPLRRPSDSAKMREYINWLVSNGFDPQRKTEYHLKLGTLNIYPDKGTLIHDQGARLPHHGLDGLRLVLQNMGRLAKPASDDAAVSISRMLIHSDLD